MNLELSKILFILSHNGFSCGKISKIFGQDENILEQISASYIFFEFSNSSGCHFNGGIVLIAS